MKEVGQETLDRMALLNNGIVGLLDTSEVTPLEAIAVLRLILMRLDEAFRMQVMGPNLPEVKEDSEMTPKEN